MIDPVTADDVKFCRSQIEIEAGLNNTQFLTDRRKPLAQALEEMKTRRPPRSLFDLCESGYCEF
jgi:hypothetical protein